MYDSKIKMGDALRSHWAQFVILDDKTNRLEPVKLELSLFFISLSLPFFATVARNISPHATYGHSPF